MLCKSIYTFQLDDMVPAFQLDTMVPAFQLDVMMLGFQLDVTCFSISRFLQNINRHVVINTAPQSTQQSLPVNWVFALIMYISVLR